MADAVGGGEEEDVAIDLGVEGLEGAGGLPQLSTTVGLPNGLKIVCGDRGGRGGRPMSPAFQVLLVGAGT
jgi:hypothetical protein